MKLDFGGCKTSIGDMTKDLEPEIKRFKEQLSPGYLFKNEKSLEPEKRQPIDNFINDKGIPTFQSHKVNARDIVKAARAIHDAYSYPKNFIVIGNGGSISSLRAFHNFLIEYSHQGAVSDSEKLLFVIDSQEPGPISKIRDRCSVSETIILPISKSGNTQGVIDVLELLIDLDYPVATVTSKGSSAGRIDKIVRNALEKRNLINSVEQLIIEHPPIGGRYTGRTCVAMIPLALLGMNEHDINEILRGADEMYEKCDINAPVSSNPALKTAAAAFWLEKKKGIDQIFAPMYSHALDGFAHLITQLLHESSCKAQEGQNITCAMGPECQHHTNQRFFGGKRNVMGMFFTVDCEHSWGLESLEGIPLDQALRCEYEGTIQAAKDANIPHIHIKIPDFTPQSAGQLLAFCQYAFGVYPSLLRDVNPFDQPAVEASKEISRKLRQDFAKKHER